MEIQDRKEDEQKKRQAEEHIDDAFDPPEDAAEMPEKNPLRNQDSTLKQVETLRLIVFVRCLLSQHHENTKPQFITDHLLATTYHSMRTTKYLLSNNT